MTLDNKDMIVVLTSLAAFERVLATEEQGASGVELERVVKFKELSEDLRQRISQALIG